MQCWTCSCWNWIYTGLFLGINACIQTVSYTIHWIQWRKCGKKFIFPYFPQFHSCFLLPHVGHWNCLWEGIVNSITEMIKRQGFKTVNLAVNYFNEFVFNRNKWLGLNDCGWIFNLPPSTLRYPCASWGQRGPVHTPALPWLQSWGRNIPELLLNAEVRHNPVLLVVSCLLCHCDTACFMVERIHHKYLCTASLATGCTFQDVLSASAVCCWWN